MKYFFGRRHHDLLEAFACSNTLLGFDYDGTLAPIVNRPADARIRASTWRLLSRASQLFPCVIVSGRAVADVRRRLPDISCHVVGNHGAEPSPHLTTIRTRVRTWRRILEGKLSEVQGVAVEDKGLSLAVHYRQARSRPAARRAILAAIGSLSRARIVGGKLALNIVAPESPHKGQALERERKRFACDRLVYIGDDETDEDVFRHDQAWRLLSIRVGQRQTSAASYFLRNQMEIDRLLETLIALRQRRHG